MRLLYRGLTLLAVALPIGAIAMAAMCLQDRPLVTRDELATSQELERAKRIVLVQDPARTGPVGLQSVTIDGRDVDLMLNYLAHRHADGVTRTVLRPGIARLQASLEWPRSPLGRYVNIDATFVDTGGMPRFDDLRIGSLPVPAAIADLLWDEGLRRLAATERGKVIANVADRVQVSIDEDRLTIAFPWDDATRTRAMRLSPADVLRLHAYQERLADALAGEPPTISLAALMPALFQLARERGANGDILRENRAAIVVLAFFVNGRGLAEIVPAATEWSKPGWRKVTLAGREDFPKHFLVSAAIAAEAGSTLAEVLGVYKEVDDSRDGSGFSFTDLGADSAGTRFGEVASRAPERARRLAHDLAAGVKESDFMPDVSDLPESILITEFVRRYGGLGGTGYSQLLATIEARVAARPLLR